MFAVQTTPPSPLLSPLFALERMDSIQRIKKIALAALAELAISLAIGTVVCAFVTTSVGVAVVIGTAIIQPIVNLVIRVIGIYAIKKFLENSSNGKIYLKIARTCALLVPYNFATSSAVNGQTLVHEAGHALMAKAVYQGANPTIEIFPFKGGVTYFSVAKLNALGKLLGEKGAAAWVAAAGPLLSLSVSSTILALSFGITKKNPETALHLQVASILDFIGHARYALSALVTSPAHLSHDFVRLSGFGIHPLAAVVTILAIPFFIRHLA